MRSLERRTEALVQVNEVLEPHKFGFASGLGVQEEINLYETLRATGVRVKKTVERATRNEPLDEARIPYFDWSSFSEGSFKQQAWSLRGKSSVVHRRYAYSGPFCWC